MSKRKKEGPDLDRYLKNGRKRYVTYAQAARIYSLPYYTFVKLAKTAGACWKVKKDVIVDLDKLDAYMETIEHFPSGCKYSREKCFS